MTVGKVAIQRHLDTHLKKKIIIKNGLAPACKTKFQSKFVQYHWNS